jgi:hypothetical protein
MASISLLLGILGMLDIWAFSVLGFDFVESNVRYSSSYSLEYTRALTTY